MPRIRVALVVVPALAAGVVVLVPADPASATMASSAAAQASAVLRDVQSNATAAHRQVAHPSLLIPTSIWHKAGLANAQGRPVLIQGIADWTHVTKQVTQRAPANTYVLPKSTRRSIAAVWASTLRLVKIDVARARKAASEHRAADAKNWDAAALADRAIASVKVQTLTVKYLLALDSSLIAKSKSQTESAFKAGVYYKFFKGPDEVRDLTMPVSAQITDMCEVAVADAAAGHAAKLRSAVSAARAAGSRATTTINAATTTAKAASLAGIYAGHHSWTINVDLLGYVNAQFAKLPACGPFDTTSTGINNPGTCNPGLNIGAAPKGRMQFFVSSCPLEVLATHKADAEAAFANDEFADIRCDEHFTAPAGADGANERCGLSQWGAAVIWNPTSKSWYFPFLKFQAASAMAYSVVLEQGYPWSASAKLAYCSPEFAALI